MSDEELEGRLSAHRQLLSRVLAQLVAADSGERQALFDWLDGRASVSDHQEDPGAVIVKAFAEQQARADEFRTVLEDVRKRFESDGSRKASERD